MDQSDIVLAWLLADLSVADVARLFDVSSATIRRWKSGRVPPRRRAEVIGRYGLKTARESIDAAFADARQCTADKLGGYPDERVHENRDGSIDAQLTVYDVPRGMKPKDVITDLAECCRALKNTFGTFVQVGMRWGSMGDGAPPVSGDRRYRGLAEGSTFYYAVENLGRVFTHALDIAKNVGKKGRNRKIETVFVRLHWNPAGVAPKEWNPAKLVYRVYKRKTRKRKGE